MTHAAALAMLVAAIWVAPATASPAGQAPPPLAAPSVDGFDPAVRAAILRAHAAAVADPSSARAAGRLGMVLHVHGQLEQARAAYARAVELDPDAFEWHYYLGLVLQSAARPEAALDEFSRALAIRSDTAARYRQADLLYDEGRLDESGQAYASLLESDPEAPLALYGLARVRQLQEDLESAADLYRRATEAFPAFGAAYYGLARVEARLGRSADAEAHFTLASRHAGERPPVADPLAARLAALATGVHERLTTASSLVAEGRADEAAAIYEDLLDEDPGDLTSLVNLLKVADFLGRFGQVDALYQRAVAAHPEAPSLPLAYGTSLLRQGRLEEAQTVLRDALRLDPDLAEGLTVMGEVQEAQGRMARARGYYRRALAARPRYRAARFDLARLLLASGRDREALEEFDRVIAEDVDDPRAPAVTVSALVLAATALDRLGDRDAARARLVEARRLAEERGTTDLLPAVDAELARLDGAR